MDKESLYKRYFEITEDALKVFEYPLRKATLMTDVENLDSSVIQLNNMLTEYLSLRSSLSDGLGFITDKSFRDKMVELRNMLMNMVVISNKIKDSIDYMRNTFDDIDQEWMTEYEQKTYSLVYDTTIKAINNIGNYIGSYIEFLDGYKPAAVVAEDNRAALLAEEEQRRRELRDKAQSEFLKQIRIKRKK